MITFLLIYYFLKYMAYNPNLDSSSLSESTSRLPFIDRNQPDLNIEMNDFQSHWKASENNLMDDK